MRAAVLIEPVGLPTVCPVPDGHPPVLTIIGDFIDQSPLWCDLTADMHRHAKTSRSNGTSRR